MAITTPDAVPGEVIEAAWGDAVRADLTTLDTNKFAKAGGAISGSVTITPPGNLTVQGGNIFFTQTSAFRINRTSSPRPFVDFYDAAGASRYGSIVGADTGTEVVSDVGPIKLMPTNGSGAAAEAARIDASTLYLGKTATALQTPGMELVHTSGSARVTMGVASMNFYANHVSAADVQGANFAQFCRNQSAIGSISQVSTTGVAYNTTSDARLKRLTRAVDPEEAVAKVAAMRPVNFVWNDAPADGEQVGFFAQELHTVAPEAVTVGHGEPGDEQDPETGIGFVPWTTDNAKLIPTIVAAVQALTTRINALEEAAA